MTDRSKRVLTRVSAECAKLTAAARASCEETQDHVTASRKAIERSLESLARPFAKGID